MIKSGKWKGKDRLLSLAGPFAVLFAAFTFGIFVSPYGQHVPFVLSGSAALTFAAIGLWNGKKNRVSFMCAFLAVAVVGFMVTWHTNSLGVDRYKRLKGVCSKFHCHALVELLKQEQVERFNDQRKKEIYANKCLDLSGLDFSNLNLRNANFSKCILQRTDFSGANLHGASFQSAYVAETIFCSLLKSNHQTDLRGAHFEDAVIEDLAWSPIEVWFGQRSKILVTAIGLQHCKMDKVSGLKTIPK